MRQPVDFFAGAQAARALRGVALLFLFLLASAPFCMPWHPRPSSTFPQELLAFVLGLPVLSGLLTSSAWRSLRWPWLAIVPLMLCGIIAAQWASGLAASSCAAGLACIELLWACALMLAVARLDPRLVMRALAWGLLVAGCLNGGLSVVQVVDSHRGALAIFNAQDGLAYGFLAQRNNFADLQMLALASAVFLPLGSIRLAVMVFLAATAMLSGSNAIVLYIIVFAAWGAILRKRLPEHSSLLLRAAGMSLLAAVMVTACKALGQKTIHVASAPILLTLWHVALQSIAQHPLWGIGWGRTPGVFYDFAARLPETSQWMAFHREAWNNVHDIVLQIGLELGLAGLVALAVFAFFLLRAILRAQTPEQAWAVTLLGIIASHSLVEFPLWTLPFLGVTAIASTLISPLRDIRLPSPVGVMPVAVAAVASMAMVLALQMGSIFLTLSELQNLHFDPRNIALNLRLAAWFDRHQQSRMAADVLLRPLITLTEIRFPPMLVPSDRYMLMQKRIDELQTYMPIGGVPYVQAMWSQINGHTSVAEKQIDKALQVDPAAARHLIEAFRFVARWMPQINPIVRRMESV